MKLLEPVDVGFVQKSVDDRLRFRRLTIDQWASRLMSERVTAVGANATVVLGDQGLCVFIDVLSFQCLVSFKVRRPVAYKVRLDEYRTSVKKNLSIMFEFFFHCFHSSDDVFVVAPRGAICNA